MRQDPLKLTKRLLIIIAAFIWIYIKLPQELWIHIIQPNYPDLITDNPWTLLVAAVWFAGIAAFAWWLLKEKQTGRQVSFKADPIPPELALKAEQRSTTSKSNRFLDAALIEKIAMISLLSVIFAQVLPDVKASGIQIAIGVALLVIVNTALSHWLSRRGTEWRSILQEFVVMTLVNFSLILAADFLLPRFDGSINLSSTLFFVLLLTLNVTLYDRYHQVYVHRSADSG